MFNGLSPTFKGILFAFIGYAGFSASDTAVKYLTPHYSIYQILTGTLLLTSCWFVLLAPKLGGLKSLYDPDNLKPHVIRIIGQFFGSILVVYLFASMPLASVYTAVFMMPFFIMLIAIPVYKEKVGRHRWLSMIIGFSGIVIAFRPWEVTFELTMWLALLGAPLFFGIVHVTMRSIKGSSDLAIGFYPVCVSGLAMIPTMFLMGDVVPMQLIHMIPLLISSLGITIGFFYLSKAFHIADASISAPMQYTQMIWALIYGYVIFGELPNWQMLIGAAIIIASGVYLIIQERHTASNH